MVPAAGFSLETVAVAGIDLSRPLRTAVGLARLPAAVARARTIVRRFAPDVVVGAGGYVCVPVVLAALLLRTPVVLLEQNVMPGRAVRLLSRRARAVAASFSETAEHLPRTRVVHTGNPVRAEVLAALPAPLWEAPSRLLVMGGSQGAHSINTAVTGAVRALLEQHADLVVTHVSGERDAAAVASAREALPEVLRERYTVRSFVDDVGASIAGADIVLMRAGGSSLAEVSALGRPMLLVPYPHAGDHQRYNAAPYVAAGAARVVPDDELSAERVEREVSRLLRDAAGWRAMAAASRACGRPDAARRVVALLAEVAA